MQAKSVYAAQRNRKPLSRYINTETDTEARIF